MFRLPAVFLALSLIPAGWSAPDKWATAVDAYTHADVSNPPPKGGIVFVGSSSIRLWTTLAQDFPNLPVINRGFGGSELADSVFYADRIVTAYQPKTVVVYAGENDINAGKSPETVHADFNAFRGKVHAALPQARIIFIAMKPSPSRWKLKENFVRGNALIAAECQKDARLIFCDIWPDMLNPQGEPRPELFVKDMLHMKPEGYVIWTKRLAPLLK
jgi:lysophospholipase L1-like esterase